MTDLTQTFDRFFRIKTSADVNGTMAFFSPDLVCYVDATLGWDLPGYDVLRSVFEQYMPNWAPPARSYATSILAGEHSALVFMTDTPELFGGELRIVAAVDFDDTGRIVRWLDYWDGSAFDPELYGQLRTPAESFPTDLGDGRVATRADRQVVHAATTLHATFAAGDASRAAELLHTDVVLEDIALRTRIVGRIETVRYLQRVLTDVPYGRDSTLRHVVGGADGGGYEWTAGQEAGALVGITALELDADGLVTRISTVYDSVQLDRDAKRALVLASLPA
jgi:hypothetical protein